MASANDVGAELEADGARIWQALADPTRRRVLDLLRERPRITGDLASHFRISRVAVMRHLQVLAAAGLVTSRKRGRERWHYLNAMPVQGIYDRWVDPRARGWAAGLGHLRRRVEAEGERVSVDRPVVDIALDVPITAAPARVFAALTLDPGAWWGHPYLRADATGLELDPRLGGALVESWSNGGAILATVTGWTDDRHLELTGPFHLGLALGVATFDLAPADQGALLRFSFRAIGAIEAPLVEQFRHGWTELVDRLKAFAETGARLGLAPDPPNTERRDG